MQGRRLRRVLAGPGDRERKDRDDEGLSSLAEGYRKAAPYMAASSSLVAAVGVFTLARLLADRKLGNEVPWLTMLGAVVGMTGGFISFFRRSCGQKK